jgi:hypothetical protein
MTNALQRTREGWLAALAGAALAGLVLLSFTSSASAAQDPIATGTTDLHMKKGFVRKLSNLGASVQGVGAGSVTGNKISLQVRDGDFDPTDAQGFLDTRGGFKFQLGNRGVPVTQLTVNTVKNAVYAKIAKARMQFGVLTPPTTGREGFGANMKAVKLSLTEKATRRISNRLGLKGSKRLNAGRVLSNTYSTAQPETVTILAQGNATLTGNNATLAKFAAKGVKVPQGFTPIAPTTQPSPTSFAFPITGGTVSPNASQGTVQAAGGVQILKQAEPFSPTVKLTNLQVNFTAKAATAELEILPSPPFPGAAGRTALVDIVLPPNSVTTTEATRTITIQGAEARLQATAASTFNDVFNQPAPPPPPASNFVVGDPLGTFSMTLQAQ